VTPTEKILEKLISYPTVSRDSNLELIRYIESYLDGYGIKSELTFNAEKTKANLYAVFGPGQSGGVMLSGHSDVVPVEGQNWSTNPFEMLDRDDRLYGRGTTDMKGFIAAVLAMVPDATKRVLAHPIHLAFSYDEEIGCVGVRSMIEMLEQTPRRPGFCIVGEPTSLEVGVAHKGKTGAICRCTGVEAHSALATNGLNAIYLASEMIGGIREIQSEIIMGGGHDYKFGVPYTTLHVGTIQGGTALNIIPNNCEFKFEIRNLKSDDPEDIMQRVRQSAAEIVSRYNVDFPQAGIEIEIFNEYPALDTDPDEDVVNFVCALVDNNDVVKIDFGTEGGLFQTRLNVPTVVCGPGSMEQGHKPDEFISKSELARCDRFLSGLLDQLSESEAFS
jgi:acetylornithine deacetylase